MKLKNTLLLSSLLIIAPSQAQTLGRLFFTPAERTAIDFPAASVPAETYYRLDGEVQQTGGRRTYWINGQPGNLPKPELAVGDSNESSLLPANSIRTQRTNSHR